MHACEWRAILWLPPWVSPSPYCPAGGKEAKQVNVGSPLYHVPAHNCTTQCALHYCTTSHHRIVPHSVGSIIVPRPTTQLYHTHRAMQGESTQVNGALLYHTSEPITQNILYHTSEPKIFCAWEFASVTRNISVQEIKKRKNLQQIQKSINLDCIQYPRAAPV